MQSPASYGADRIVFEDKETARVSHLGFSELGFDFTHVAMVDLNNDSIEEVIVKDTQSGSTARHTILGLSDSDASVIGQIDAQKLMLAYDTQNGVRSILAFKDTNNDFEYDIYRWDALGAQYRTIKGGGE